MPPHRPVVEPSRKHDPYAAFRFRDFLIFSIGGNLAVIGGQMANLAVGWELYQRTNQPIALGWVGITHGLPIILLALPAGHMADRFNRKNLVVCWQILVVLSALGLAAVSYWKAPIPLVYLCLLASSIGQAFIGPARSALFPMLVPLEELTNAVTWNSGGFQVASMIGPALGGAVIAITGHTWPAYVVSAGCNLAFLFTVGSLRTRTEGRNVGEPVTLKSLGAGIHFVRDNRIILGTITLDLFAVLLGGAISLLPVYARDILRVGPPGLGWLRAAPSAGALAMALVVAHVPPMKKSGRAMLLAVSCFGAVTIVFGLSKIFWLSLLMLFIAGAVDNISVVVRHSLVQILTPDAMRGRVSAVNGIFITTSNDIGDFESGLVAQFLGPVISVVSGGVGTILVVIATALFWPDLRRFGSLQPPRRS